MDRYSDQLSDHHRYADIHAVLVAHVESILGLTVEDRMMDRYFTKL